VLNCSGRGDKDVMTASKFLDISGEVGEAPPGTAGAR
jgi:hypothetical protein